MRWPTCSILVHFFAFAAPASAHYTMLLPSTATAKKGETVKLTYQWGHPFEHQLFDAPRPHSLIVIAPDGRKSELTEQLEKSTRPAGDKDAVVYQLRFTPQERGDFLFVLQTPPMWMEEDGVFLQDTAAFVLHVQAQKGWDARSGDDFDLLPLTRPYGLRAGMVFQAQIHGSKSSGLVEIERYNARPPKMLPPEEHITRTVKPDPNGVITTTLTEPGWWCLTAARSHGTRMREGKSYPLRQRRTLWVFVDEAASTSPKR